MFSVIFEVHPKADRWDAYLGYASLLRPELVQVDGFIDNIRYRSLRREGWVLSLSTWRDEKSLIRWRTLAVHNGVQVQGRLEVFHDYHLRVGQVVADSHIPAGQCLRELRLDETETGRAKAVSLIELERPDDPRDVAMAVADRYGLTPGPDGLVGWDVFDAILDPGKLLLLLAWRDAAAVRVDEPHGTRVRQIRIIRDYGMRQRHEAPQYYPDVPDPA